MNDILYVYLKFDVEDREKREKVEELLPRVDVLLEKNGWEYTKFQNMYRPIKGTDPDDTWQEAEMALKEAEWLKEFEPYFGIGTLMNACELEEIVAPEAGTVDEAKLKRYREYYEKRGKYAHGIIVDEKNNLRDGYMTYLLAREEGKHRPDVMLVRKGQTFKKIVAGKCEGDTERNAWYYEDGPAVCPGDVVITPDGKNLKVDYVGYVAGKYDCERYETIEQKEFR